MQRTGNFSDSFEVVICCKYITNAFVDGLDDCDQFNSINLFCHYFLIHFLFSICSPLSQLFLTVECVPSDPGHPKVIASQLQNVKITLIIILNNRKSSYHELLRPCDPVLPRWVVFVNISLKKNILKSQFEEAKHQEPGCIRYAHNASQTSYFYLNIYIRLQIFINSNNIFQTSYIL